MKLIKSVIVLGILFGSFYNLIAQSTFFKNYDGIPITTNLWGKEHLMYQNYSFKDIDSAGIDAVVVTNVDTALYTALRNNNTQFNLLPYQAFYDSGRQGITYYSERPYSVWEAEGDTAYSINLEHPGGVYYPGIDSSGGIKNDASNDTPCYIINGPNYNCNLAKSLLSKRVIPYTADYRIKIGWRNGAPPAGIENTDYEDDIVCKLSVTTTDSKGITTQLAEVTKKVKNLLPMDVYKIIQLTYNEADKSVEDYLLQKILWRSGTEDEFYNVIPNVEYKVYWYALPYLNLYVEKIEIYDNAAKELITNELPSNSYLYKEISFEPNINPFTRTEVKGWYPIDEPDLIDMQQCVKKLGQLIETATPEISLMPSFACSWDGNINGAGTPSKIIEYSKRGYYHGSIMHHYLYDNPHIPTIIYDYKIANIICFIANLNYYQAADENFICSIQSGRWECDLAPLHSIIHPNPVQFLYNVNMALLYGAKGIDVNDYYYFMNEDTLKRTGMVGVFSNTQAVYNKYPSPIWYTLRDEISPRLKGDFGKLLKNITQQSQGELAQDNSQIEMGSVKFNKTWPGDYDCGVFEHNDPDQRDKKYLMLVARWYNMYMRDPYPLNTECYGLTEKNYTVRDYYTNESRYLTPINGKVTIYDGISAGTARLYELMPALKYGGQVMVTDTIKSNTELLGNLQINPNISLYIKDSTYTVSNIINIKNGGSISRIGRGNIVFSGTGKITNEVWANSLFYTCQNGHPKLIWGALTGTQKYVIYRHTNTTTYDSIAVVYSTDSTFQQCFVDDEININLDGHHANFDINYKVKKINGQRVVYTNIITVPMPGVILDKGNIAVLDFAIEQNYPNPFNASTLIKYSIPQTGKVSIKLYDMLGREVKNLFQGIKEMGAYELNINCNDLASGVYIYRIQYNEKALSKKMMLLK